MRLTVVGCSGSIPGPDSPASCYLVEADGFRLVLDLGSGALGPLQRHVRLQDLDAVALSHLHADHCLDLVDLQVARAHDPRGGYGPLPVYGPGATVGRLVRAGGQAMRTAFDHQRWRPGGSFPIGPLRVTVERVDHPVEAYAMRIEHGRHVLTYSGDTDTSDGLLAAARDADLLLCEAAFHEGRDSARHVHLTDRGAGEVAAAAKARRLVLTHLPPWNDPERTLRVAREEFGGDAEVARSGARYDI